MSRWYQLIERAEMQARVQQAAPYTQQQANWTVQQLEAVGIGTQSQALEAVKRYYGLVIDDGSAAHEPASMSDPPQSETSPTPPTDSDVQRHVDHVCEHLIAGRTTAAQRSGLSTAVERAGRISNGSDAAVGRALRLSR